MLVIPFSVMVGFMNCKNPGSMYACFSTIGGIRLPPTEENSKIYKQYYVIWINNSNLSLIPVEFESWLPSYSSYDAISVRLVLSL